MHLAVDCNLTSDMATDLAPRGIRVNAVTPGRLTPRDCPALLVEFPLMPSVPLARRAQPADIGELGPWPVEGAGGQYITGETMLCSGRMGMR